MEAHVARRPDSACVGTHRLLGALLDQDAWVVHPRAKGKVSASARAAVVSARIFS